MKKILIMLSLSFILVSFCACGTNGGPSGGNGGTGSGSGGSGGTGSSEQIPNYKSVNDYIIDEENFEITVNSYTKSSGALATRVDIKNVSEHTYIETAFDLLFLDEDDNVQFLTKAGVYNNIEPDSTCSMYFDDFDNMLETGKIKKPIVRCVIGNLEEHYFANRK